MPEQGSTAVLALGPAEVLLDSLVPSKTNPRVWFDPDHIRETADSIERVGLISRLTVRPSGDEFEVVAGECRLKAFHLLRDRGCTAIAGVPWEGTVPVEIKALSNADALLLQADENDKRRDINPVERSRSYWHMVESGEWGEGQEARIAIAKARGVSESLVYQRLQLMKAIPEAQEECAKGGISEGHLREIARGTPAEQERSLTWLLFNQGYGPDGKLDLRHARRESIPSVRELIAWQRRIRPDLATAPFSTARFDLLPQAGACSDCPKRTLHEVELAGDLFGGDDLCCDGECYAAKCRAHVLNLIEEYEREEKPFALISTGYQDPDPFEGRDVLSANGYQEQQNGGAIGIIAHVSPGSHGKQVGQTIPIRIIRRAAPAAESPAPLPPAATTPSLPDVEVPAGYVKTPAGGLQREVPSAADKHEESHGSENVQRPQNALEAFAINPGATLLVTSPSGGEACYLVVAATLNDASFPEELSVRVELRSATGQDFGESEIVSREGVLYWVSKSGEFPVEVLPAGDPRTIVVRTYSEAAANQEESRKAEREEFVAACNCVQELVYQADPESQALAVLAWHLFGEFEEGDVWKFGKRLGIDLPEEEEHEGQFYVAILEACASKISGEILGAILASRIETTYQAETIKSVLAKRGFSIEEKPATGRQPWEIRHEVGTTEATVCCFNDWFMPPDIADFPIKKTLDLTGLIEGTESVEYLISIYDEGWPAEKLLADDRRDLYAALNEFLQDFAPGGKWSRKPAPCNNPTDDVLEVTEEIEEAIDSGKVFAVRPYQTIRTSDGQGPWIVIAVKPSGAMKPKGKKRAVECHTLTLVHRKISGGLSTPQDWPGKWADKDGIHWGLDTDVLITVDGLDQGDDVRALVEAAK